MGQIAVRGRFTPTDRAVYAATTQRAIGSYSDPSEVLQEVGKALKWIAKDVGFRSTDMEDWGYIIPRITELLQRYYSDLTIRDLRTAFEMCVIGELDEYLPKDRDGRPDRSHYQNFNAEYVCKILNAYRKMRAATLARVEASRPREERTISEEERAALWLETKRGCVLAYLEYKYTGRLRISPIAEMLCYDVLSGVGLADDMAVTMEEQGEILRRTAESLTAREDYGRYQSKRRCELVAAFDRMIKDEVQILDYIKI